VIAAERAGYEWFAGIWRFLAPLAGLLALSGLAAAYLTNVPWQILVAVSVVLLALLFIEGAYRMWRVSLPPAGQLELGFPDVHIKTGSPLLIETSESKTFPGHRESLIVVTVTVTNREVQRRAILAFSAHVTRPKPHHSVQKLSRTYEDHPHPTFISDPLKLDPQDHREGEVAFLWSHDMDFLFGRDKSEEEVLEFVMENLRLNATDHLSTISIDLELPGTWYRLTSSSKDNE
jgi:hypothetical protein